MENCQFLFAAGTVTSETGTVTGSLLVMWTRAPPCGVRSLKVSVACAGLPPKTVLEVTDSPDNCTVLGGLTCRSAPLLVPLVLAVIVTVVVLVTLYVLTLKRAVLLDPGTVTTVWGRATAGLLLWRFTRTPAVGATLLRMTVPKKVSPPVTIGSSNVMLLMAPLTGLTVKVEVALLVPTVAVMTTGCGAVTGEVVTVKAAGTRFPVFTTTDGGTCATAFEDVKKTV